MYIAHIRLINRASCEELRITSPVISSPAWRQTARGSVSLRSFRRKSPMIPCLCDAPHGHSACYPRPTSAQSRLDDINCLLTKLFSISLAAAQPLAGCRDDWSCARCLLSHRVICTSAASALCWLALRHVPGRLFKCSVEPNMGIFNVPRTRK